MNVIKMEAPSSHPSIYSLLHTEQVEHDELCPVYSPTEPYPVICQCELIRKVRAQYLEHLQWERFLMWKMKGTEFDSENIVNDLNEMIRAAGGQ